MEYAFKSPFLIFYHLLFMKLFPKMMAITPEIQLISSATVEANINTFMVRSSVREMSSIYSASKRFYYK